MIAMPEYRICIAPMIDWTDRHYRYMMRLITKKTMLYTEMITANAIIHGPYQQLLKHSQEEHPLTLQLGGNNPKDLAYCAKLAESLGFDGVNLNVGCPSDRVQQGAFGLSLMYQPKLVAECVYAMKKSVKIPVSVKCRTGVDHYDSFEALENFITCIVQANVDYVFIHARKGWLNGLSPKKNRIIPPLQYETVYQIRSLFPEKFIGINGGISTLNQAQDHLQKVDGIMIGRQAYHQPMMFKDVDSLFYQQPQTSLTPFEVSTLLMPYIDNELKMSRVKLNHITRHALNLFNGHPKSKSYRRFLSENAHAKNADIAVFKEAVSYLK